MSGEICCCGSIGAPASVRFCGAEGHHRYWYGDRELISVSKVIRMVYPQKSFDKADPKVVEHARDRGVRADHYLEEYVRTGSVHIPDGEWIEVIDRFEIVKTWWDQHIPFPSRPQPICYSLDDGIAGTPDFLIDDGEGFVLDLKNTYQPEIAWTLQLGAALTYSGAVQAAILHVSPKVYKPEGCRLLAYDAEECIAAWRDCVAWWKRIQTMERKSGKPERAAGVRA